MKPSRQSDRIENDSQDSNSQNRLSLLSAGKPQFEREQLAAQQLSMRKSPVIAYHNHRKNKNSMSIISDSQQHSFTTQVEPTYPKNGQHSKKSSLKNCDMSFSQQENSSLMFHHQNEAQRNIQLDKVNPKMIEKYWLVDSLNVNTTVSKEPEPNLNKQFVLQVNQAIQYFQQKQPLHPLAKQQYKIQPFNFSVRSSSDNNENLEQDNIILRNQVQKLQYKLKASKDKNSTSLNEMQRHISMLANEKVQLERELNEMRISMKESEIKLSHYFEMYEKERIEKEQIAFAYQQFILNQKQTESAAIQDIFSLHSKGPQGALTQQQLQQQFSQTHQFQFQQQQQSSKKRRDNLSQTRDLQQSLITERVNNKPKNPNYSLVYHQAQPQAYTRQPSREASPSDKRQKQKQQQQRYETNDPNKTLDQLRYSYQNPIMDPSMATPQAHIDFMEFNNSSHKKCDGKANYSDYSCSKDFNYEQFTHSQLLKPKKHNFKFMNENQIKSTILKGTLSSFGRRQTDASTNHQNQNSEQSDF